MTYRPKPIDVTGVKLSGKILRLTESLAENAHDLWSQQRFSQGWRYGAKRDDAKREHPCLVPYKRLPDSEKEFDRRSSMETLKAIISLGYQIVSPADNGPIDQTGSGPDDDIEALWRQARGLEFTDTPSLLRLWQSRDLDRWSESLDIYHDLGDLFLKLGEPLLGYDVVTEGLLFWPDDVRLLQLMALSLARSGSTEPAIDILIALYDKGHRDEETLGLLGRTYKDKAEHLSSTVDSLRHWRAAFEIYHESFKATGGYWSGINAATIACILQEKRRAKELATAVRKACLAERELARAKDQDTYWLVATLAEAALILEDYKEVENLYLEAAEMARGRWGDLSATRRNARLLIEHLRPKAEVKAALERSLWMPRVIVFSGHMIDGPSRMSPRLPAELEPMVKEAILNRLREHKGCVGYASAACGADILFLEAVLELGGEIHIVLPYEKNQFVKDSVDIIPGGNWGERVEGLLCEASEVVVASGERVGAGGVFYDYANRLLLGLAAIRARQLETELVGLAVWDGKPEYVPGGTADTVRFWRSSGLNVAIVDPTGLGDEPMPRPGVSPPLDSDRPATPPPDTEAIKQRIVAFLFADATGFSRLTEHQIPIFVDRFFGLVSSTIKDRNYSVLAKETWGDGLYMVFPTVGEAGSFGLELTERIVATDWIGVGLPSDFDLRVALHAGPTYCYRNPVTDKTGFMGTHMTQTARIEPIAPPGEVYASQAFAALACAEGVTEFRCDYVGRVSLAKRYGTLPMFHLRRNAVLPTGLA